MSPHWDDLKVFLAVARSETLSRAGQVLRMDPATVGRRIARLETAYGSALFAKSQNGYALTDVGQRLMTPAIRAEQAMAEAAEELAAPTAGLSGQIRIGAPDGAANFLLPQVCARIGNENPDLEIQILALPRIVNLTRREADMVLAVSAPTAGRLTVQKVSDYKLHLAASDAYLAAHPTIGKPGDLSGHRFVGYIQDMIFDKELDYLGDAGVQDVALASNSASVQLNWIRQNAGIGFVHDFALPAYPGLRKVLASDISLTRSFYLIRHADDRRLDRLNRFASALISGLRAEIAALEDRA
jgi:DNA-binding transcriptional LysR family regulator